MIRRRKILDVLSRARLLELAKEFNLSGLSGKSKDEIAASIAGERSAKTPELLAALTRDELKVVCRSAGLDDSGREKSAIIARLLGNDVDEKSDALQVETKTSATEPVESGVEAIAEAEFQLTPDAANTATSRGSRRSRETSSPSESAATSASSKRPIEQYEHSDKTRANNPPVGLVTPKTDPDEGQKRKKYAYDPHLDPQLVWAGKAEHTSFEVPTVSLHVHERIDPLSIIAAVRKRNGDKTAGRQVQQSLFEEPEENPPLREAIDFYKHPHGWTNRLIAGDSLLVMNSLLEKEGMAGKVQMVYIDPPYGIKYGSNFQPFVQRQPVKDGKDEDLT